MNRINQLFNSNKKDLLSIYFCAGDPTLDGTADVIRTLEKHGVSMIEVGWDIEKALIIFIPMEYNDRQYSGDSFPCSCT